MDIWPVESDFQQKPVSYFPKKNHIHVAQDLRKLELIGMCFSSHVCQKPNIAFHQKRIEIYLIVPQWENSGVTEASQKSVRVCKFTLRHKKEE